MPAALSLDLRRRIIAAWLDKEESWQEIADRFGVGVATVDRLVARYRRTGDVAPTQQKYGADPILDDAAVELVRKLLLKRPDSTLPELVGALEEQHGISVSRSTMGRTVRERLGWSRKKRVSSRRSATARA
jgi:transposase